MTKWLRLFTTLLVSTQWIPLVNGYILHSLSPSRPASSLRSSSSSVDPTVSAKFKILTCSASSCCKKRSILGQDEYATFSALYTRINESEFPNVEVEETSCLGGCKLAPCVAIEHEDFVGSVAVEGMTTEEFGARIFHKIVTESDADRVWSSVENAIRIMAAEEEDL